MTVNVEKKSNHRANVIRVSEIVPHTNADTLEIIPIPPALAYQVVVKKGQFKVGDLAVYIQPDSVVPNIEQFRFIWEPYLGEADAAGHTPERRRRITVRKFRKEWSEGLLMPVNDFRDIYNPKLEPLDWKEGDDVSDIIGITHYDPDKGKESTYGESLAAPRRRYPRSLKGWFFFLLHKIGFKKDGQQLTEEVSFTVPVYDVEALKNYKNAFEPGEQVVVTEKIHGSNARFLYLDGKQYAGSHNYWKAQGSNCVWRKALTQNPWIETFCKAHPGYTLYGEVVPTQKGFDYGCKDGEVKFFAFDVLMPNGEYVSYSLLPEFWRCWDGNVVPTLYKGPFDLEKIKTVVDGPSTVPGAKHIREGVVIRADKERHVRGLGRLQLKLVSNMFLEKDSK